MIIRYHQLDSYVRDDIRSLENKGHIAYIRYLLLKRMTINEIDAELARNGLAGASHQQYKRYFEHVLMPLLTKAKLAKYYKRYRETYKDASLSFDRTFSGSETDRISFIEIAKETETDAFFNKEFINFYKVANIPSDDHGKPLIANLKIDWADLLLHEKRHIIDGMLADGHSAASISEHLDTMYDIQLPKVKITQYAKSFMNTQRKDFERVIEGLEHEKNSIEEQIQYVRDNEDDFTIGERVSSISTLKSKKEQIDAQMKRLKGAHSNASYSQGALEFANIREMFSDVALRAHRRFKMMDERSEDSIVDPLSKLVGMMAKASDKIERMEEVMNQTTNQTVSEQMLEVVIPTLDRVEEEERKALELYQRTFAQPEEEEADIIGMED